MRRQFLMASIPYNNSEFHVTECGGSLHDRTSHIDEYSSSAKIPMPSRTIAPVSSSDSLSAPSLNLTRVASAPSAFRSTPPTSPIPVTPNKSNYTSPSRRSLDRTSAGESSRPSVSRTSSAHLRRARTRLQQDPSEWSSPDDDDISLSPDAPSSVDDYDEEDDENESLLQTPRISAFACASAKRTADFHQLFPEVGTEDYLIEDYGCALQREILIQGRLYISEHHICFHANIFGWITNLVVPFTDIIAIEKRMTAYVIPNAIMITTGAGLKHTFASFLNRDVTYDVKVNIWRLRCEGGFAKEDALDTEKTEQPAQQHHIVQSLLKLPQLSAQPPHRPTQCECGQHYLDVAMDSTFPGTPESIYNLLFSSGFVKGFLVNEQNLRDLQISDWAPEETGSRLLSRNMSYIKPLNASLGPKQTKCELRDETLHADFDDYVSMLSTTRTPDIPSGQAFSVKTRTCIMWTGAASTRVLVTTTVEWTARSFIKAIIDRSCLEGTRGYYRDLEKAMRQYINDHLGEFMPEGVEAPSPQSAEMLEEIASSPPAEAVPLHSPESVPFRGLLGLITRALQWVLELTTGTLCVARQSTWGAIELGIDILSHLNVTTVLAMVVFALIICNFWTLSNLWDSRRREGMEAGSREEERLAGVATEAVKTLMEETAALHRTALERLNVLSSPHLNVPTEEMQMLGRALDAIGERVSAVRARLMDLN